MELCKIKFWISASKHAETAGPTEIMICIILIYFSFYCSCDLYNWDLFFRITESVHNLAWTKWLGMTSFEVNSAWRLLSLIDAIYKRHNISVRSDAESNKLISTCEDDTKFTRKFAQTRQFAYSAKYCTASFYNAVYDVFLNCSWFTATFSQSEPSKK